MDQPLARHNMPHLRHSPGKEGNNQQDLSSHLKHPGLAPSNPNECTPMSPDRTNLRHTPKNEVILQLGAVDTTPSSLVEICGLTLAELRYTPMPITPNHLAHFQVLGLPQTLPLPMDNMPTLEQGQQGSNENEPVTATIQNSISFHHNPSQSGISSLQKSSSRGGGMFQIGYGGSDLAQAPQICPLPPEQILSLTKPSGPQHSPKRISPIIMTNFEEPRRRLTTVNPNKQATNDTAHYYYEVSGQIDNSGTQNLDQNGQDLNPNDQNGPRGKNNQTLDLQFLVDECPPQTPVMMGDVDRTKYSYHEQQYPSQIFQLQPQPQPQQQQQQQRQHQHYCPPMVSVPNLPVPTMPARPIVMGTMGADNYLIGGGDLSESDSWQRMGYGDYHRHVAALPRKASKNRSSRGHMKETNRLDIPAANHSVALKQLESHRPTEYSPNAYGDFSPREPSTSALQSQHSLTSTPLTTSTAIYPSVDYIGQDEDDFDIIYPQ